MTATADVSVVPVTQRCSTLFLRIHPARIAFLRFLLEGYDNLAVLTTIAPESGIVALKFSEDSRADVWEILASIAPQLVCSSSPGEQRRTSDAPYPTREHKP